MDVKESTGWTVAQVVSRLHRHDISPSAPPSYYCPYLADNEDGPVAVDAVLAVEDMARHVTDEGWQLALGLKAAGWQVVGHRCDVDQADVAQWLRTLRSVTGKNPRTVLLQDKREWDAGAGKGTIASRTMDPDYRFRNVRALAECPDTFRLTVVKDAHQNPPYHKASADEIQAHGWVVYYHPTIVCHLAPYLRPQHIVRTPHSIDPVYIPPFLSGERRRPAVISGAVSGAYPLRRRIIKEASAFVGLTVLPHPGYRNDGCRTPQYLNDLGRFRVAICTCSMYGYALRKIVEASAVGCVVVTDLPEDDQLPHLEDNLVRVHPDWPTKKIASLVRDAVASWDGERQRQVAERVRERYNYSKVGLELATEVETLRGAYQCT
jgi:hypothetical protein